MSRHELRSRMGMVLQDTPRLYEVQFAALAAEV